MDRDHLNNLIHDIDALVGCLGFECIEAEWDGAQRTLRLFIDKMNGGGVDISDCVRVNRQLADWDAPLSQYSLEISSPGLERPIRFPKHFRKFIGSSVQLRTIEKVEGSRSYIGSIEEAGEEGFSLGTEAGLLPISYKNIKSCRLVYEGNPR